MKISEFSLIDDEVRVFQINIKLSSNPVAELKIREKDSHCRLIVLKTMDRLIVKQLKKKKNSNSNVEIFCSDVNILKYNPSKFSMDNAWTSKPTCANVTLEIPTSNKHRTSR